MIILVLLALSLACNVYAIGWYVFRRRHMYAITTMYGTEYVLPITPWRIRWERFTKGTM